MFIRHKQQTAVWKQMHFLSFCYLRKRAALPFELFSSWTTLGLIAASVQFQLVGISLFCYLSICMLETLGYPQVVTSADSWNICQQPSWLIILCLNNFSCRKTQITQNGEFRWLWYYSSALLLTQQLIRRSLTQFPLAKKH